MRTFVLSVGLAAVAIVGMAGGPARGATLAGDGGVGAAQVAATVSGDAPLSFRECIARGKVVTLNVFIGVECVASDGERYYAGIAFDGDTGTIVTGP